MKHDTRERNPWHSIWLGVLEIGPLRHIASCCPRLPTQLPLIAQHRSPSGAEAPKTGSQTRSQCFSRKAAETKHKHIYLFASKQRNNKTFNISFIFFVYLFSIWTVLLFFCVCFPARRRRSSSFWSLISLSNFLCRSWFSMDSGSVAFNLMWLNLFGSRCSAAAPLIILLCEWYERFRSRFRCVLIQNNNVFFHPVVLRCTFINKRSLKINRRLFLFLVGFSECKSHVTQT